MPPRALLPVLLTTALGLAQGLAPGFLAGCGSDAAPQAPATQRVKIFLIGIGDGGRRGALLSCGDSAVPVTVMLPADEPPLEGAVRALVRLPRSVITDTGLANTLVHSQLSLVSARVEDGHAVVQLEGTFRSVPSPCQRERVRAQLEHTVLQFPEVRRADLLINGEPLETVLGRVPRSPGSASPTPAPEPSRPSGGSLGPAEPSDRPAEPLVQR